MLRPLLIIGIGGSGGKTIRAIKHVLIQNLESFGYSGEIPQAWQFLQIDTTYTQGEYGFASPMLASHEFSSVVPPGILHNQLFSAFEKTCSPRELQRFLAGWGVPSQANPIYRSLSMERADARQIGITQFTSTLKAINQSIARMHAPIAEGELEEVSKTLGLGLPQVEPQVFLFTSIGGFSGSGLLVDIAELLKGTTLARWSREAVSFIYTPDVFRSVASGSTSSIAMNALGAMNELTASRFVGLSEQSEELYSKFGILCGSESEYGCRTNILVGATNISNKLKDQTADEIILRFGTHFAKAILEGGIPRFLEMQIASVCEQSLSAIDNSGLTSKENEIVRYGGWLYSKLPPIWTFAPLADSILEQVARSKTSDLSWKQFWRGRRTRPLIEAIPFDSKVRLSIITGWFIARIFGLIEIDFDKSSKHNNNLGSRLISEEVANFLLGQGLALGDKHHDEKVTASSSAHSSTFGRTVRIWNPTLQIPGWSIFPNPLLPVHPEDEAKVNWLLPSLLTSAGIALCNFGKTGKIDFIQPYNFLSHLGQEVRAYAYNHKYQNLPFSEGVLPNGQNVNCKMVSDWVIEGSMPSERALVHLLSSQFEALGNRKEALLATLKQLINQYSLAWEELSGVSWHELPETWELKDDINLALTSIHEYVEQL